MLDAEATEINLTRPFLKAGKHLEERFERSAMPFEVAGQGKLGKVKKRACGRVWGKDKDMACSGNESNGL